jgi:hypothetical protein
MRENIQSGNTPFRKAYIQAVVDGIEVDDGVVRMIEDKRADSSGRRKPRHGLGRCSQMCTEVALPRGIEPLFSP